MLQEYIDELKLNPSHTYERLNSKSEQRHGWDTDFYTYREIDTEGKVVREFTICDSTKMYPPFTRNIYFD